jgi:hypothetical protein
VQFQFMLDKAVTGGEFITIKRTYLKDGTTYHLTLMFSNFLGRISSNNIVLQTGEQSTPM